MKIAFYHNHKEDIGHMVHLLRIIAAIKERSPLARIFMFQAGKPQPLFERTLFFKQKTAYEMIW